MEQTVYVDLFFLINFSMDLLCFFITAKLLSTRVLTKRAVLASLLGGIYACLSLFLYVSGLLAALIDLAACVLMCAVAVKRRGELGETLGFSIVYAAVSAVVGGVMTALFSFFNKSIFTSS